ncbi:hypothetical protein TNCV_3624521 [Trichonephila clavipes]|nr:hypothetical protein TNCV_3624521 [Trichonephila clavipes]
MSNTVCASGIRNTCMSDLSSGNEDSENLPITKKIYTPQQPHYVTSFFVEKLSHPERQDPVLELDSVAISVSSRPKLTELYEEKYFLHVLRRRPIGCPDSRKRAYPIMPDMMDMIDSDID